MYFFYPKGPLCVVVVGKWVFALLYDTFIHKEIRIEKKKFSSWITLVGARFITSGFWWSEEWGEGIFQSSIYFQKGCPKRRKRVRALIVFLKSDKIVRWLRCCTDYYLKNFGHALGFANFLNRIEWKILILVISYYGILPFLERCMCWLSMKISFQRGVIKREVPEFLAFWKPLLSFILFKWFPKVQFTIFLLVSLVNRSHKSTFLLRIENIFFFINCWNL